MASTIVTITMFIIGSIIHNKHIPTPIRILYYSLMWRCLNLLLDTFLALRQKYVCKLLKWGTKLLARSKQDPSNHITSAELSICIAPPAGAGVNTHALYEKDNASGCALFITMPV